jgi:hypothetical protein
MRSLLLLAGLAAGALAACAEASAPLPPPEEVVLVVNRGSATLSLLRVEAPTAVTTIPLGGAAPAPSTLAARGAWAVVPLGPEDAAAVVDLKAGVVARTVSLPAGSGATGAAIVDDSIAYVGNPNLTSVTRINYLTGDTASVAVGQTPQGVVSTRGKVFVLNGNLAGAVPAGPSWVSVVDPVTNRLATGVDSILLPGPGNALSGEAAQDGVLYVMNAGPDDGITDGRLSLVDPVGRRELGNFAGFGNFPGPVATNGADRLYVSSLSQGVMVFDLLNRQVIRGAGNGVAIPGNTGLTVDGQGRIYALESGPCSGGASGKVHILRPNLSELRAVDVGECPAAAVVTEIPPN